MWVNGDRSSSHWLSCSTAPSWPRSRQPASTAQAAPTPIRGSRPNSSHGRRRPAPRPPAAAPAPRRAAGAPARRGRRCCSAVGEPGAAPATASSDGRAERGRTAGGSAAQREPARPPVAAPARRAAGLLGRAAAAPPGSPYAGGDERRRCPSIAAGTRRRWPAVPPSAGDQLWACGRCRRAASPTPLATPPSTAPRAGERRPSSRAARPRCSRQASASGPAQARAGRGRARPLRQQRRRRGRGAPRAANADRADQAAASPASSASTHQRSPAYGRICWAQPSGESQDSQRRPRPASPTAAQQEGDAEHRDADAPGAARALSVSWAATAPTAAKTSPARREAEARTPPSRPPAGPAATRPTARRARREQQVRRDATSSAAVSARVPADHVGADQLQPAGLLLGPGVPDDGEQARSGHDQDAAGPPIRQAVSAPRLVAEHRAVAGPRAPGCRRWSPRTPARSAAVG